MTLLWLPLVLDRMGWRRKEGQLAEAFPALYYVTSTLCHIRNDEMNLARKGLTPIGHVSFSNLTGKARTDGDGL